MNELPRGTVLGVLTIVHVFEYYDFPRLFSCRSATGQMYLVCSTYDDDERAEWLYLPLSSHRLNAVVAGSIPMYSAFKNPEGGYLFSVRTFQDVRAAEVNHILPELVVDEDLPAPSYVISEPAGIVQEDLAIPPRSVASATRRETFDYHIYPHSLNIQEISSRKLGAILTTTQELVDALGQAALGAPTIRGPVPTEVLQQTKINVANVFHGSFGVQFRSAQLSDLLSQSVVAAALNEFSLLLQAGDSEDLLSNKLHALRGRVASKYRRLLKELSDLQSGVVLDWGSVSSEGGGRFELSSTQVRNAYAIVDRIDTEMAQEVTISGKLIGFNLRTQRYEILSSEDGKTYAGKVAEGAALEVPNPSIGQFYEADLRMLVETQSTSGDELIRWVLVRLGALRSGNV